MLCWVSYCHPQAPMAQTLAPTFLLRVGNGCPCLQSWGTAGQAAKDATGDIIMMIVPV